MGATLLVNPEYDLKLLFLEIKMKYNSMKKQAFKDWKRGTKTPQWAKINKRKRIYEPEYYTTLNNLQGTLNFLDHKFDKCNLENLGNYIYEIKDIIKPRHIDKEDYSMQYQIYNSGIWNVFSSYYKDKTGYGVHWKLEEVNYSRLAEKIYKITEKNKLKCLGGVRWLVWVKIT